MKMSKMHRGIPWLVGCVTLVCLALGILVIVRFYRPPVIGTYDGKIVRDLSVSEAGAFAGSRFQLVRQAYLTNLEIYRGLPMRPTYTDANRMSESLQATLIERINDDPANRAAMATLPPEAVANLASQVSVVLSCASGMQLSDYLKFVGEGGQFVLPENLDPAERSELLSPDVTDSSTVPREKIRAKFEQLYQTAQASLKRGCGLVGWAPQVDGFKIALERVRTVQDAGNVLMGRLNERDQRLFRGYLAKGGLMFHRPPDSVVQMVSGPVVCAEVALIVRDARDDYYPLWITLLYDATRQRWWVTNVFRMISVRAANAPPLVF